MLLHVVGAHVDVDWTGAGGGGQPWARSSRQGKQRAAGNLWCGHGRVVSSCALLVGHEDTLSTNLTNNVNIASPEGLS